MHTRASLSQLNKEQLIDIILVQQDQINQLMNSVQQLQNQVKDLQAQVTELRSNKRQATPFSKNKRKKNPKKPGRKKGQGTFTNKKAPDPKEYTQAPTELPSDQQQCSCGGEFVDQAVELVTVTDLPPLPKPLVKPFLVHVASCSNCSSKVRGQHPEVASDQYGATAHRFGPRLFAAAHCLHYELGVTMNKVPQVLELLNGVKITQSALTQDALRRARRKLGSHYKELVKEIRNAFSVHTDDTGWKVGGEVAYLMVFEGEDITVYQIRPQHRNNEVREVIGESFEGTLITDRGSSYESEKLDHVEQQKCLAHVQKNLSEALAKQVGRARSFPKRLKELLGEALLIWKENKEEKLTAEEYVLRAELVEKQVDYHLRDGRELKNEDNQRLLKTLGKQHRRGNLLRFLEDPEIEPTNNRAERALRPAVISRKVSQCSKNKDGATATSVFKSVIRTLKRRGFRIVEGLTALFRAEDFPILEPG